MAGFGRAVRRAADLDGAGVTPGAWAAVMYRCDVLLGGADRRVRHAAVVAALVDPDPGPSGSLVSWLGLDRGAGPVGAVEAGEVRRVALLVTRAAARGAGEGVDRLLLAGVERRFVERAGSVGGVEAGLREWGHEVAAAAPSMSSASALLVARAQHALLTMGAQLMDRVEVMDGVGHGRLREAVEASRERWRGALETWRGMVPRQPQALGALRRGLVGVQLGLVGASDEERLAGLLATGFGGNLIAATAVTPEGQRPGSGLVGAAVVLETRSDLSGVVEPRPVQRPQSVTPAAAAEPRESAAAVSRGPVPAAGQGLAAPGVERGRVWEVDRVSLSDTGRLRELAAERDAGLTAEAAMAGAPGGDGLVTVAESGRRARATIAAAGVPLAMFWSRRVFPAVREEFVAAASLRLMELAATWDPGRATWSTYAYGQLGYFVKEFLRQQARVRETPSDSFHAMPGAEERQVAGCVPTRPEEQAIVDDEQARVSRLVEGLPPGVRRVAEERLGLDGDERRLLREVGADMGMSPSTVHRLERRAREELKAAYTRDQNPSGPVSVEGLADALLPFIRSVARPDERSKRRAEGLGPGR